ncbi:MAG: carbohydrate ABC transporter permease [Desulfurococcales archaeon]|nr:carbohydrate ABC transporter permease [Desulfurococcales archaeon]
MVVGTDVETVRRGRRTAVLLAAILAASAPIIIVYAILVISSFANRMVTGGYMEGLHFTLENWILFFQGKLTTSAASVYTAWDITRYIGNTFLVALGVSGVVTALSTLSGYSFSRMKFRGRSALMQFLILLHAFPGVALIIAVYTLYVYTKLSLPPSLWVPYSIFYVVVARAALEIPMSIWVMKGFFDKVPWEVEWSALVDGASRIRVWRDIVMPLVKPGIATVAIFSFMAGWEDLIYVLVFLPPTQKTLATYIASLLAGGSLEVVHLPIVAAAGTLYLLPTILFFLFARNYMLQSSLSGIKG